MAGPPCLTVDAARDADVRGRLSARRAATGPCTSQSLGPGAGESVAAGRMAGSGSGPARPQVGSGSLDPAIFPMVNETVSDQQVPGRLSLERKDHVCSSPPVPFSLFSSQPSRGPCG